MDFNQWLLELIGEDTQRTASTKAGMSESTLSRQLSRGALRPEMVIALCRGYGRSPVTGLIETGYLHEWEAEGVGIPYALQEATNQQLLDEIMRRSDPEALYLFGDPTGESIDYEMDDDLAARRTDTPDEGPDVDLDFYDLAVADSSPDEEEGEPGDYDA